MPIELPVYQPQTQGGSTIQLPNQPYDVAESFQKGYEAGRILAGIPQQEEQLKLARMRQQLFQSEQSFPLEQQKLQDEHGNVPYGRSKIVSDILNNPGVVSNITSGPVVPVGNDPFSETMRFAAPEGNGQVPSDVVPLNVPGQDVGVSPSKVQEYLMTKARHPDNSNNLTISRYVDPNGRPIWVDKHGNMSVDGVPYHGPADKTYAPKLVGQIDDEPVMFDPTTRKLIFAMSGEPVSVEQWKNFVQLGGPTLNFQKGTDGFMYGFAQRGPNQAQGVQTTIPDPNAPPQEAGATQPPKQVPFTSDSPQAEKIQNELRNLKDSKVLLNEMKSLFDQVKKEGHVGLIKGTYTNARNLISGGSFDPYAETYNNNKKAFTASLRGMTGDDSRFSDADRLSLIGALAKIEKDPKVADQQWKLVFNIINKREKIRWEDEKLGKKTPTTEMTIKAPTGNVHTIDDPEFGQIRISK